MTYGHLQADCLYTGISSGPNARCRVWEAFTFTFYTNVIDRQTDRQDNGPIAWGEPFYKRSPKNLPVVADNEWQGIMCQCWMLTVHL